MIARPHHLAAVLAAVKDKPEAGGPEGGPSLTAAARDGHRDMWPGRRNGSARGRTTECS